MVNNSTIYNKSDLFPQLNGEYNVTPLYMENNTIMRKVTTWINITNKMFHEIDETQSVLLCISIYKIQE